MADLLKTLGDFKAFIAANPYDGTTEQIVGVSLVLSKAAETLDKGVFSLWKKETGINDKVLSKLKVIGDTLNKVDGKKKADVIKVLPASYSTIHRLCALKPEELVTGAKSGSITPSLSIRQADTYVKQVKYPRQFLEGEKGRWGTKEETLYKVLRPEDLNLGGEALLELEKALRQVCAEHGVQLRKATESSEGTLKRQDDAEREFFWKGVLEKELTKKWFQKTPEEVRKQFNIKTLEELLDTPLRSFTGFLMNAAGGREAFWQEHGQAYVAKLHVQQAKTEDRAQRFNLKRRLEQVLQERTQLAIWRNVLVKENGFIY